MRRSREFVTRSPIHLADLAFHAESGEAEAQLQLGVLFLLGEEVEQDFEAALRWLEKISGAPGAAQLAEGLRKYRAVCPVPSIFTYIDRISELGRQAQSFVSRGLRSAQPVLDPSPELQMGAPGMRWWAAAVRRLRAEAVFAPGESRRARFRKAGVWLGIALGVATAAAGVLFAGMLIGSAPVAFAVAVFAGFAVRGLAYGWRLQRLRAGHIPEWLVAFDFSEAGAEQGIEARFEDSAVSGYLRAWRWRTVAAAMAGCVCAVMLRWPGLRFALLPHAVLRVGWLYRAVMVLQKALPLLAALVPVFVFPLETLWIWLVKRVVRARAASVTERVLVRAEMQGIEAGVDALWRAVGAKRQGEYQSALERYLRLRTREAVASPESALAVRSLLLTLARLDLAALSEALESCRRVETSVAAARALADAGHNPAQELCVAELSAEAATLGGLAAQRRWSELQIHAEALQERARECCGDLRGRVSGTPPVVLSPGSDPYRVLGIEVDTPTPLVKKLRLKLAQLYHPDVSEGPGNSTKMAELNAAFDAVMKERDRRSA